MKQAGVMLILNQGMILAVERKTKDGKYGLPGGKFNPDPPDNDKDTNDTAIRETLEETGVSVKECSFIYERVELGDGPAGVDFYSRCYYATSWSGIPCNVEGLAVKWLTAEEVCNTKAAFGSYNRKTLDIFKTMFPNVYIKGE
jgi:ADP-ribose pyrophosphatase YjhB (NUDIX family)